MNQNNWRDYRKAPTPTTAGPRGPNAPPASQSGRWPNTTGPRLHPKDAVPFKNQPTSTPITRSDAYMSKLRALIPIASVMQRQGYTMQPLNESELLLKRRCTGCGKITKKKPEIIRPETKLDANNSTLSASRDYRNPDQAILTDLQCKFHVGQVENRIWTCCKQHVSAGAPPCGGASAHVPQFYHPNELVKLYQYYPTPEPEFPLRLSLSGTPKICSAVALDCEMGTAVSGDSELIRITVIDYFTSDILLNSFVEPDVPMLHLNTKYSGVTWADIRKAKREGTCLYGTAAARKALWHFVGPQTVVVGHGASSDLRALRWIHNAVVDSQVVESARMKKKQEEKEAATKLAMMERGENVDNLFEDGNVDAKPVIPGASAIPKQKKPKGTGDLALKTLSKKYLGRDIQMKGKVGHDSLEDAVAARDVVHWQISNP